MPGHWIFVGPNGLRAGWSVLIFAGIVYAAMMLAGGLLSPYVHIAKDQSIAPFTGFLMEIAQLIPAVIATAIMARLERRPVLFYGYRGRARAVRFVSGIVWGFIAISAVVLMLRELGFLSLDGWTLDAATAFRYAAAWGVVFVAVGICEETMFRGYAQFTLTRGVGFWPGAILLCLPFGVMHGSNPGESPVGLVGVGAASLIFCLSLWYTGSLWWAVGFHAAWDWGQSYFYGTADSGLIAQGHLFREHPVGPAVWSGGATGPEGSVLVLPLLLVIALLMAAWWGKRGEQPFKGMAWKPGRLP